MRSVDLYIIAAGKGTRMNSGVPKALATIREEPCLTNTLRLLSDKFRRVFVATNAVAQCHWGAYFRDLRSTYAELTTVVNLPIDSGLGDGHATLEAVLAAERTQETPLTEDIVISWGDVFFQSADIIDEILSRTYEGSGLLPVVHDKNPYVSLLVDERMHCIAADFAKHGEYHPSGFHDQSVFRFKRRKLIESLSDLHRALWKSGHYLSPGGELSLLYSFHQLYNSNDPAIVYETAYPTLSFNTLSDVAAIQRMMTPESETARESAKVLEFPT
jgi:bifunctional N-acetylglucosamine-1-phosphate-uridyltransferase/glucosamine-1-phosphate-acetyltransferase GlmU-like protein